MVYATLLCCAMLGGQDAPAGSAPSDLAAYQSAEKAAGRDAGAQVRLALWCEAHGLSAERIRHLGLAVLADPSNTLARGLLGLVDYHGKWQRPDEISKAVQDDPERKARVQEYLQRRARTPERAEDHQKLALWCEQNGLKDQAVAHFHRALRLDPSREVAWKHLGYKKVGGRWQKPELVDAQKHEDEHQKRANKHWKPLLERWREGLASKDKARRVSAEKGLAEVTDPRAVPAVWATFALGGAERQKVSVRVLGQIDSPGSSRALALLALSSRSTVVRESATQVLRRRDPRDFTPILIGLLRDTIKYEMKKLRGPGSQGELLVKNKDANVKRIYTPLSAPSVALMPNDYLGLDPNGLPVIERSLGLYSTGMQPVGIFGATGITTPRPSPAQAAAVFSRAGLPASVSQKLGAAVAQNVNSGVLDLGGPANAQLWEEQRFIRQMQIPIGQMMLDAQLSAQVAQQQLAGDAQAIDDYNAAIQANNTQIRQVLTDSTGVDAGQDRTAWQKWLIDLFGYAAAPSGSSSETPTIVEQVPLAYQPQAAPSVVDQPVQTLLWRHSCFGAGTPVRTIDGLRRIESLRIGDQVLTQNPKTGALKYRAVVTVFHNPPNATLRIELDNDSIVLTGIHRLWKAGQGWVMARELKAGDTLRTLGGTVEIKSIGEDRKQRVYNLQVADSESFFVGPSGVLAHDNSLINPTPEPFDAVNLATKSMKP
ncbi:MAG: polymorphic toxin-type HINT domain-containing protein [Isosphaeraceae bacterium]